MSEQNTTLDPRFISEQGPDTFGPLNVPFVDEEGDPENVLCAPADGSAGMVLTTDEMRIGIVALRFGDVGIYAPTDAGLLRNLAASYLNMADELDGGSAVQ